MSKEHKFWPELIVPTWTNLLLFVYIFCLFYFVQIFRLTLPLLCEDWIYSYYFEGNVCGRPLLLIIKIPALGNISCARPRVPRRKHVVAEALRYSTCSNFESHKSSMFCRRQIGFGVAFYWQAKSISMLPLLTTYWSSELSAPVDHSLFIAPS